VPAAVSMTSCIPRMTESTIKTLVSAINADI
jgi:hypothetical protein